MPSAERYAEPHRRYHTLDHLTEVLDVTLGRDDRGVLPSPPEHRTAVVLAALFHDAIYDPASSTNEADSADLATEVLSRLAADPQGAAEARGTVDLALVAKVARLVLLTRQHRCPAGDAAAEALLDADLAVLARDPVGYDRYAAAVREEYRVYDDDLYRLGRIAALEGLLAGHALSTGSALFAGHALSTGSALFAGHTLSTGSALADSVDSVVTPAGPLTAEARARANLRRELLALTVG